MKIHQSRYVHDADHMTVEQLMSQYDIDISEDGVVWDPVEMKEFENVALWATYMAEQEEAESAYQKINKTRYYDDEE